MYGISLQDILRYEGPLAKHGSFIFSRCNVNNLIKEAAELGIVHNFYGVNLTTLKSTCERVTIIDVYYDYYTNCLIPVILAKTSIPTIRKPS